MDKPKGPTALVPVGAASHAMPVEGGASHTDELHAALAASAALVERHLWDRVLPLCGEWLNLARQMNDCIHPNWRIGSLARLAPQDVPGRRAVIEDLLQERARHLARGSVADFRQLAAGFQDVVARLWHALRAHDRLTAAHQSCERALAGLVERTIRAYATHQGREVSAELRRRREAREREHTRLVAREDLEIARTRRAIAEEDVGRARVLAELRRLADEEHPGRKRTRLEAETDEQVAFIRERLRLEREVRALLAEAYPAYSAARLDEMAARLVGSGDRLDPDLLAAFGTGAGDKGGAR